MLKGKGGSEMIEDIKQRMESCRNRYEEMKSEDNDAELEFEIGYWQGASEILEILGIEIEGVNK